MSPVATRVSVIVCTHNPRPEYLARVLAALREQTLPLAEWELLLIDNASAEPLAGRFDLTWHPNGRHVREEQLGLSFARRRGVLEAHCNVVVFVDDDNVLNEDYLKIVDTVMADQSIGALGGGGYPIFEDGFVAPPHFYNLSIWLAVGAQFALITNVLEDLIDLTPLHTHVFGAGMAIRRDEMMALFALPHFPLLTDRQGLALTSGGDVEICHLLALRGAKLFYCSRLIFGHLIPPSRVDRAYLHKLCTSTPYQEVIRGYKAVRRARANRGNPKYWLKTAARAMLSNGRRFARIELATLLSYPQLLPLEDRKIVLNARACYTRSARET